MLRYLPPAAFAAAAFSLPPGASADPPALPAPVFDDAGFGDTALDRLDVPARTARPDTRRPDPRHADAAADRVRDAGGRAPLRYFGYRPPGEFAGLTVYPVRYSPDPLPAPRYRPQDEFGVPAVPVPDPSFGGPGLPADVEYGDPVRPRPTGVDPVPSDETRFDVGDFQPTAPPPVTGDDPYAPRPDYAPRDSYRPQTAPSYATPYGTPPAVPLPSYGGPAPVQEYGGPAYGAPRYGGPTYGGGIDDLYGPGGVHGAGYGDVPDAAGGLCDLGTCDSVGVPLFTRVRVEDPDHIAPNSIRKVVAVMDPCGPLPSRNPIKRLIDRRRAAADPLCAACPPGLVFVEICVPPCACERVRVTRGGAHVKLDYGKYEVELTSREGYVKVDYDD